MENAGIKIELDEKTKVLANPELLSRALGNIIRNAIRYAGSAEEILIQAEKAEENQVKITIADSSAGVPDSALDKIFDPLYRVESERSRQTGDSGLGLAIVKTCVKVCGGKVYARNRQPSGLAVDILLKSGI